MINLNFSKLGLCYSLAIIGIIVQLLLTFFIKDEVSDLDVLSAIKRSKTEICKRELAVFAATSSNKIKPFLKRSCKLDSKVEIRKVFCASNNTEGLIALDETITSAQECLEQCFAYGHSYGGYHLSSKICYCGDHADHISNLNESKCDNLEEFDYFRVNQGIFLSKRQLPVIDDGIPSNMKIAFIFTLHGSNSLQVQRIIENIYSRAHIYYLHIDRRADNLFQELLRLESEYPNIFLTRFRLSTVWGSPNLLNVIINSLIDLSFHKYDYLINLSESDFPIKPLTLLEKYLSVDPTTIFLKEHNMKGYKFIKKQGLDRNFYQCEDRVWRVGRRKLPRGIVYSGGSDWFALPRDFCDYITQNLNIFNSLVKSLLDVYNYTLLPAESFFHTLASNSEFCDKVADSNLRITNWNRKNGCKCQHRDVVDWCGCSPLIYRSLDWAKLRKTNSTANLFFSRKFDPTISSSIINAVEHKLLRNSKSSPGEFDTRYWQKIPYNKPQENTNPDFNSLFLEQFSLFCLKQLENSLKWRNNSRYEMSEIDAYFNRDRFVGLVIRYCDKSVCLNILIKKSNEAHLAYLNRKCFETDGRKLKVIEVNHNFDTSERLFRDYKPMHKQSNIVVYHEWDIMNISLPQDAISRSLQFSWISPLKQLELRQQVKFKDTQESTRLSLAHKFNIASTIASGEWILKILRRNTDCVRYKFLVFDESSFRDEKISQDQFDRYYSVSTICSESDHDGYNSDLISSCVDEEWSLLAKQSKTMLFNKN